jgi:hypothetical protein
MNEQNQPNNEDPNELTPREMVSLQPLVPGMAYVICKMIGEESLAQTAYMIAVGAGVLSVAVNAVIFRADNQNPNARSDLALHLAPKIVTMLSPLFLRLFQ